MAGRMVTGLRCNAMRMTGAGPCGVGRARLAWPHVFPPIVLCMGVYNLHSRIWGNLDVRYWGEGGGSKHINGRTAVHVKSWGTEIRS